MISNNWKLTTCNTPIYRMYVCRYAEALKMELNANSASREGSTALHHVCFKNNGSYEVALFLIDECDADLHCCTNLVRLKIIFLIIPSQTLIFLIIPTQTLILLIIPSQTLIFLIFRPKHLYSWLFQPKHLYSWLFRPNTHNFNTFSFSYHLFYVSYPFIRPKFTLLPFSSLFLTCFSLQLIYPHPTGTQPLWPMRIPWTYESPTVTNRDTGSLVYLRFLYCWNIYIYIYIHIYMHIHII